MTRASSFVRTLAEQRRQEQTRTMQRIPSYAVFLLVLVLLQLGTLFFNTRYSSTEHMGYAVSTRSLSSLVPPSSSPQLPSLLSQSQYSSTTAAATSLRMAADTSSSSSSKTTAMRKLSTDRFKTHPLMMSIQEREASLRQPSSSSSQRNPRQAAAAAAEVATTTTTGGSSTLKRIKGFFNNGQQWKKGGTTTDRTKNGPITLPNSFWSSSTTTTTTTRPQRSSALQRAIDKTAIFYNLYMPLNATDSMVKDVLSISREQLRQLGQSNLRDTMVRYVLIGKDVPNDRICPNNKDSGSITCQRIAHHARGGEELTLANVQRYCGQNPDHQVVYLHNKASLNQSPHNDRSRRIATKAAVSDECVLGIMGGSSMGDNKKEEEDDEPTDKDGTNNNNNNTTTTTVTMVETEQTCNVCASQLQLVPFIHFPANMWTARCSYINRLVPIDQDYAGKRATMCQHLHQHGKDPHCNFTTTTTTTITTDKDRMTQVIQDRMMNDVELQKSAGLQRYSNERWVIGHPSLQPCDVFPHPYMSDVRTGIDWEPKLNVWDRVYRRQTSWIWRSIWFHLKQVYYFYGTLEGSDGDGKPFCDKLFGGLRPVNPCTATDQYKGIVPLTNQPNEIV